MGRIRRRRLLTPLEIGDRAREARPRGDSRWRVLEVEDLLLAAWVAGLGYLARRAMGTPEGFLAQVDGPTHWAVLLLAGAWLFLLFTRGPEDDDRDRAIMRRLLLVGPAFPVLSIYAIIASAVHTRWYGEQPLSADGYPPWPGPSVSGLWRRTAALPVMFVGDAVFRGALSITRVGDDFEMNEENVFLLLALGAVYVFSVAGPRIAAGATLSPLVWVARFGLFLAAVWYGFEAPLAAS